MMEFIRNRKAQDLISIIVMAIIVIAIVVLMLVVFRKIFILK